MKLLKIASLVALLIAVSPTAMLADKTIQAMLRGIEEVPALSTTGSGLFRGRDDK